MDHTLSDRHDFCCVTHYYLGRVVASQSDNYPGTTGRNSYRFSPFSSYAARYGSRHCSVQNTKPSLCPTTELNNTHSFWARLIFIRLGSKTFLLSIKIPKPLVQPNFRSRIYPYAFLACSQSASSSSRLQSVGCLPCSLRLCSMC